MKFIFLMLLTLIFALIEKIFSRTTIDFSFYHKSEDIDRIMNELKSTCYPSLKEVSADQILQNSDKNPLFSKLKYYDITFSPKSTTNNSNNKLRKNQKDKINIFILAGEHPRELISTEFILNFIKYLCMGNRDEKYLNLINTFNFRIVLNANPIAREKVETGEYCRRTNLNNVDINRNWDIHWSLETNDPEEFPGYSPFSETETKFLKLSVGDYKPKLFLTVHSGAYGLFMPYAYLKEEENMKNVLNQIKSNFCSVCDVGAPSKLIGYTSRGTCLDYVYDNFKVPYSLAWEIFTNEKTFPEMEAYSKANSSSEDNNKGMQTTSNSFLSLNEEAAYELVSTFTVSDLRFKTNKAQVRVYSEDENEYCVKLFNPLTKQHYEFINITWTKALIHLLNYVKEN